MLIPTAVLASKSRGLDFKRLAFVDVGWTYRRPKPIAGACAPDKRRNSPDSTRYEFYCVPRLKTLLCPTRPPHPIEPITTQLSPQRAISTNKNFARLHS